MTFFYVATGGLSFAGEVSITSSAFEYVATNGITLNGTFSVINFPVTIRLTKSVIEVLFSNQSHQMPDGGLTVGGSANVSFDEGNVHAATGGVVVSGEATVNFSIPYIATGGLTLGGTAGLIASAFMFVAAGSGGAVLGGDSVAASSRNHTATGGLTLSGESNIIINYNVFDATGGVILGGVSPGEFVLSHIATGGLVLSGDVNLFLDVSYIASGSGGAVLGGASVVSSVREYIAIGGVILSGEAIAGTTTEEQVIASGGVSVSGLAIFSISYNHVPKRGGLNHYRDDFDRYNFSPEWTVQSGNWFLIQDSNQDNVVGYDPNEPVVTTTDYTSLGAVLTRSIEEGSPDYRVEIDITVQELGSPTTKMWFITNINNEHAMGVVARFQDINNFYAAVFNNETGGIESSSYSIIKRETGSYSTLGSQAFVGSFSTSGEPYTERLKFEVFGNRLKLFGNGSRPDLIVFDSTFTTAGRSGIIYKLL